MVSWKLNSQTFAGDPRADNMVNAFDSTIWPPTPISPEVKALLARFFDLVDAQDPEGSGKRLAEEVFTEDGTLMTANGTFQGKSGMCCIPSVVLLSGGPGG